ncbi:MAG: MFS transporter [Steroidobacteraceae bacterium]
MNPENKHATAVTPAAGLTLSEAIAGTWPLLLGMGILMLGAGLQGTLLGLRATLEGFPAYITGMVMSCYFLGYMAGSVATPRLVQQVGHVRVFAALTALASVAILVQGVFVTPLLWSVARIASGFCFAGIYVVAESWLNDRAGNHNRGALLSTYMVVLYGGLGSGQFLLMLADPGNTRLFMLIAGLISLALVPMALTAQRAPEFNVPESISLRSLYRSSPLGVVGVAASGAITASVFTMGPVYAHLLELSTGQIATFMATGIFAAVFTQLPLGRFSDRVDRRNILIAVCTLASLTAASAMMFGKQSVFALLGLSAVFGGLALTIYSLALSHVNDHLHPAQMVAASSSLILLNGAGAVCGPVAVATLMSLWRPEAYFASLAMLTALLALYGIWRKQRRAPVPPEQKVHFVAAQPQAVSGPMLVGANEALEALKEAGHDSR